LHCAFLDWKRSYFIIEVRVGRVGMILGRDKEYFWREKSRVGFSVGDIG